MLSIATDHDVVNVRQPLSINAQVLDKTHHPCNDATVVAKIKDPFGNVSEVSLPWVLSEDGVYQALYRPADKGEYSVSIVANVGGTNLEKSTTFSAVESSVEFLHPSLDVASIERVAKAGGGTSDITGNSEKAVAAILKQLSENQKLLDLIEERELRDAPILLLAILGVWIAEWFLRRRSGLA
jgi:hypothetical protein